MSIFMKIPGKIAYATTSSAIVKVARKSDSFAEAERKCDEAVKQNFKIYMHPFFQK